MRIRFGFSGLVNIQRQLRKVRRNPPRLVARQPALPTIDLAIQKPRLLEYLLQWCGN